MALDLQKYCADLGSSREYIEKPWSSGPWSYATNGHVMVRVARLPNISEADHPAAQKAPGMFEGANFSGLRPLPTFTLPPQDNGSMCDCYGGTLHDCPHCHCACPSCGGTGKMPPDRNTSIGIDGISFAARYVTWLAGLPLVQVATANTKGEATAFSFGGGQALLMPRTKPDARHIDLTFTEAALTSAV